MFINYKNRLLSNSIGLFLIICLVSSCFSNKKIVSYNHIGKSENNKIAYYSDSIYIEKTDILQILLSNLDDQTLQQYNTNNGNGTYVIDNMGSIDLPLIGKIKVIGLTKLHLKTTIETLIQDKKIGINPLVNIKITNFHVTVLGEVNKPGLINLPDEQINLSELIGMVGDLTVFAKRNNVLLIREKNGIRTFSRFDLNDSIMFTPEFYNLQNRDVLYFEPNGIKAFNASQSRTFLGFTSGILTLALLIIGFTR